MKSPKQDKQWFAERCGELLVMDLPANISIVIDEVIERHDLPNTSENRKVVSV